MRLNEKSVGDEATKTTQRGDKSQLTDLFAKSQIEIDCPKMETAMMKGINSRADKIRASKGKKVKKDNDEFKESNLKHSINGYLFGNMPGLDFKRGEQIRWYVMGAGTETGLHTPHWHGNTVVSMGQRMDMIEAMYAE